MLGLWLEDENEVEMGTNESQSVTSMCELQAVDDGVSVPVTFLGKLRVDEVCRG
jgi:hypothetical protein